MEHGRVIILANHASIGDFLINKVFHLFPNAEINYWRSGAFSIEDGENCFQMEPPCNDMDFYNFWDSKSRENIKKKFKSPNFYLVEYCDTAFLDNVLSSLKESGFIDYELAYIKDEKVLLKFIKKNIKNQ